MFDDLHPAEKVWLAFWGSIALALLICLAVVAVSAITGIGWDAPVH